jgi:hypothetical protein
MIFRMADAAPNRSMAGELSQAMAWPQNTIPNITTKTPGYLMEL